MTEGSPISEAVEEALLMRRISAMFDWADPMPRAVAEGARAAFGFRDLDAELARLVEDELLQGTAVRADGEQRLLTFEAPGLTVAVEATEIGGSRRLVGQLVPAGPGRVWLESGGGAADPAAREARQGSEPARPAQGADGAQTGAENAIQAPADHLGRFTLTLVPAGPVRLRCELPSGERVVTEWVVI
ncbi:MAG TPA: hypothetical protein VGM10_17365 [Actinocrinis sp.]|jgi:hypothetical protein